MTKEHTNNKDLPLSTKTVLANAVAMALFGVSYDAGASWACDTAASCSRSCFAEAQSADLNKCERERQTADRDCESAFSSCTNPEDDPNCCNEVRQQCRTTNNDTEIACIADAKRAVFDSCIEGCNFWYFLCDVSSSW
jgi:hypothetical protein